MKKSLLIAFILLNFNLFSQPFKDGNYKFEINYLTDLIKGGNYTGVNNIILQSSLNKITLNLKDTYHIFNIVSKKRIALEGVEGMIYETVSDGSSYNFFFTKPTSTTYSILEVGVQSGSAATYHVINWNNY